MSKENTMQCRVVHLDVEDCSEEWLRQQSYAMKNQLLGGFGTCSSLVLYGIRFLAREFLGTILDIEVDHSETFQAQAYPYAS